MKWGMPDCFIVSDMIGFLSSCENCAEAVQYICLTCKFWIGWFYYYLHFGNSLYFKRISVGWALTFFACLVSEVFSLVQ